MIPINTAGFFTQFWSAMQWLRYGAGGYVPVQYPFGLLLMGGIFVALAQWVLRWIMSRLT